MEGENTDHVTQVLDQAQMPPSNVETFQPQYDVNVMNRKFALVLLGEKPFVIKETRTKNHGLSIRIQPVPTFEMWYRNTIATYDKGKPVTWAQQWLMDPDRRQYDDVVFHPSPPGEDDAPEGVYNRWQGFAYEPKKGKSCEKLIAHIFNNICSENAELFDWVIAFFAKIVQRPRERVGVALVLRGKQGCGKSKVFEIFGKLLGPHHKVADSARYLTGQFNAHMEDCLLLQIDEGFWAGDKEALGRLKGLITSSQQMIEGKGRDPVLMDNYVHLGMTSNEIWVVPAGMEERRFCVLDVSDAEMQNAEYFAAIDAEAENGGYEAFLQYLMDFDLKKVNLRNIPQTAALLEQKIRGLSAEMAWWYQCLQEGEIIAGEGWPDKIPKVYFYGQYITYCNSIAKRSQHLDKGKLYQEIKNELEEVGKDFVACRLSDQSGKRMWAYTMPDLEACRNQFSKKIKYEIEWQDVSM